MRLNKFIIGFFICLVSALGCAHFSNPELPKVPQLSRTDAIDRASRVSEINYIIDLKIGSEKDNFEGQTTLSFNLSNADSDLRIDLYGATLFQITTNGQATPLNYNQQYITIPQNQLQVGKNEISIHYERPYAKDGKGLHRFKDPEDQRTYLHTQFESYYANRMFPNFDQPDLKATYTMSVTAPTDWEVITSVRESKKEKVGDKETKWIFPQSEKFSTYLISLHAGPYSTWEKKGKIPLRLFARKSLAKYVQPATWFSVTEQGFDFFNSYFGYAYPYKKYDQVIAPEFNSGAMENVAAVTFSESFISRGDYSDQILRRQANVILHEMAHMWFGNLVTMKWWDDLWLNESFATYMASVAMSKMPKFKDVTWQDFNSTKSWGYWEDQLSTTHPILATIDNTDQAGANFDGITYAKGAATLKQLHYYIGDQSFKAGLQSYFKKFAEKNTTLSDFVQSLAEASQTDLQFWTPEWLKTAGLNTVEAKWACEGNSLTSLSLVQTAPANHPTLRSHRMNVALLKNQKNSLKVMKAIPVVVTGEVTPVETKGLNCPDMVFPNLGDHAYIKVKFDPTSLPVLRQNIAKINDSLLKQMAWSSLWDLVQSGDESILEYSKVLLSEGLPKEKNPMILERLVSTLASSRGGGDVISYLETPQLKGLASVKSLRTRIQDVLKNLLFNAKGGSEMQKIFFNAYVRSVSEPEHLKGLQDLLLGKRKLNQFNLDQDKRWNLIGHLASFNFGDIQKLAASEALKDKSFDGVLSQKIIQSTLMPFDEKIKVIENFKASSDPRSLRETQAELRGLFPEAQSELRKKYSQRFYADFEEVLKKKTLPEQSSFFYILQPDICTQDEVTQLVQFEKKHHSQLEASLSNVMLKVKDEGLRCIKIVGKAR